MAAVCHAINVRREIAVHEAGTAGGAGVAVHRLLTRHVLYCSLITFSSTSSSAARTSSECHGGVSSLSQACEQKRPDGKCHICARLLVEDVAGCGDESP